jgi:hypothetical protein
VGEDWRGVKFLITNPERRDDILDTLSDYTQEPEIVDLETVSVTSLEPMVATFIMKTWPGTSIKKVERI